MTCASDAELRARQGGLLGGASPGGLAGTPACANWLPTTALINVLLQRKKELGWRRVEDADAASLRVQLALPRVPRGCARGAVCAVAAAATLLFQALLLLSGTCSSAAHEPTGWVAADVVAARLERRWRARWSHSRSSSSITPAKRTSASWWPPRGRRRGVGGGGGG